MSISRFRVFNRRSHQRRRIYLCRRLRLGGICLQELPGLSMGHRRDSLRRPRLRRRCRLTPGATRRLQMGTIRKPPTGTIRKPQMGAIRKPPMGARMGRGRPVRSHRLRLRLQRRITGLRVCRRRSGRMLLGRSGRCHRYRFTRRRRFLRAGFFHRVDLTRCHRRG
jgi:hypothetical protein